MKNSDFGKHCLIIVSLILFLMQVIPAQTNIPEGNESGTWTLANSPYQINGEITVPNGALLIIKPGVEVVFMGHYKFNVQGRLLAVGTQKDTIKFRAENKSTGWWGIRFRGTSYLNDTSKIVYCSFKNGNANTGDFIDRSGGAILIYGFEKVLVSNCLFDSNTQSGDNLNTGGPAIAIWYATAIVTNCTFTHNGGPADGAILCWASTKAIISNNIISNNHGMWGAIMLGGSLENKPTITGNIISNNVADYEGGGIDIYMESNALIINNIIIHNRAQYGAGIRFVYCKSKSGPIVINNTIAYNSANTGGGIECTNNSDPIFINNILYGNSATDGSQVYIDDGNSDPVFKFCDIQGGKEGFRGPGAGANYTGTYENNIDCDPLFINANTNDFHLSDSSCCIGAGKDSLIIGSILYCAPQCDYQGCLRPSPIGSKPDIGAFENSLPNSLTGIIEVLNQLPKEFQLYQNYPNPFNPITKIKYSIPSVGTQRAVSVQIKVYDIIGNEVAILVNEEKPSGTYEVEFDGSELTSGIYFYTMQAGSFIDTKKFILIK